jgi:hypothetical protein
VAILGDVVKDRDLREQVRKAASAVRAAPLWSSRKLAAIHGDFLFETYVLGRLLVVLHLDGWSIRLVTPAGKTPSLPKKPAKKSRGWSTFEVSKAGMVVEICAGTNVADIHGHDRHPDISVQEPPGEQHPTYRHVRGLFDAKYRTRAMSRITAHEFAEFARWVDLLKQVGSRPPWPTAAPFDANAIVTNGRGSTEPLQELQLRGVREIMGFGLSGSPSVRP